jgi:hypothetical protein
VDGSVTGGRKCSWNPTNSFYELHSKKIIAVEETSQLIRNQEQHGFTVVVLQA